MNLYSALIVLPIAILLIGTLIDVFVRPGLSNTGRIIWVVGCLLFWPTMIAYVMLRPLASRVGNRSDIELSSADPRTRLVAAVMAHDESRMSNVRFAKVVANLRQGK